VRDGIPEAIEAVARRQPAATLLHAPGHAPLTYADYSAQIDHVRTRLTGWGFAPGDIVAGCVASRPHMAACATFPSHRRSRR
jgi:hypothetical protein